MSARHALLGALMQRPSYPYELADRLEARLGPAWAINSGQISKEIAKMEEEGLIEQVAGPAGARANRRVFAATESGAAEYERWFAESPGGVRLSRRPVLVKITLAGPRRLRDVLAQIDAYELECAEQLQGLSRRFNEVPPDGPQVRADSVLLRLGLSADIFQLEGELRWARHAHEIISWLLEREALWPSARERSGAASDDVERAQARERLFARMAARPLRALADAQETAAQDPAADSTGDGHGDEDR